MADEIQGTPLVPEGMVDPDPAVMVLPTNADLEAQNDENPDKKEGEGAPADTGDGEAAKKPDDGGAADPDVEAEAPTQYEEVADPGEFTPGDYTFEATVYDEEGKNPKTHKIVSLEQWDELLETEPNFGTSAAVLRAERAAQKMDRGIERDKARYDEQRASYEDAVKQQEARDTQTLQWQSELDYLVTKGELPPMPKEFHVSTADWSKVEVKAQPAVKAQMDLLAYFRTENATRAKAGLAPMSSLLDAWNGYAREQEKVAASTTRTQNIEARKAAGAKVASSSPRPATAAPKGISVGRTGLLG